MKFGKRGDIRNAAQSFDREKIFVTKGGHKFNVYDMIQEANVDTDIYEVMKKYHCMEDEAIEIMQAKGGIKGVYGEFVELQESITGFADIQRVQQRAEQMFNELPVDIRQKYGHNLEKFLDDVEVWKKQQQVIKPAQPEGATTNESK